MAKQTGTSKLLSQNLTSEDAKVLKNVISVGMVYHQDIADTRESLKETIEDASKKLGIDKAVIAEVIRTAYKQDYLEKSERREEVDAIMKMTGFDGSKDDE